MNSDYPLGQEMPFQSANAFVGSVRKPRGQCLPFSLIAFLSLPNQRKRMRRFPARAILQQRMMFEYLVQNSWPLQVTDCKKNQIMRSRAHARMTYGGVPQCT